MARGLLLLALPFASFCVACTGATTATEACTYTAVAEGEPRTGPFVPRVHVHLVAGGAAMLQRLSSRDNHWEDVCTAPCDGWAPALGRYRVSTPEREPTVRFPRKTTAARARAHRSR